MGLIVLTVGLVMVRMDGANTNLSVLVSGTILSVIIMRPTPNSRPWLLLVAAYVVCNCQHLYLGLRHAYKYNW